jgi:glycosyltransferase involved in cell wall biosynthesis
MTPRVPPLKRLKTLKILAVCHRAYTGVTDQGGAETMMHSLLRYLAANGFDVNVVLFGSTPVKTEVDGVKIHVRRHARDFDDLARWCDVVITHLGGTAAARSVKKPLVQLVHNTSHYTVGFLGAGVDLAIYNSEWVRAHHESNKTSKMVRSWDKEGHSTYQKRRAWKWDHVLVRPPAEDPPLATAKPGGYITLVNLTPNKGPEILYALAESRPDLEFMGVIGGYEPKNQVIRTLRNVTIHPHTRDVDQFYSKTSVVIMPSVYESYGRVAVEAMSRGIPVLASDTPGLRECLGPKGMVLPREDLDAWRTDLAHVLNSYDYFSAFASERYQELYDQTPGDLENLAIALKGLV